MVFAFTPPNAQAQQSPLHVGVRGGLGQASFYGDDVEDAGYRPGFTGGVYLTYQVNRAFSIQPELLYTVRGAKDHDVAATTAVEDFRVRQDFIEVPILFKLSAPLQPVTPRLFAGPSFNFATNHEIDGVDADDSFSDFGVGGVIGGEIAYDLGHGVLDEVALDGRWGFGLSELGDTANIESVSNTVFSGTINLRFNI